ncbi:MAG: Fe(3+) ABC transporter substrate-binding protein [Rhodospirillales bacterium]|nr:Fe(3+) ABC transporter substrate-binding protein [Rhodospirillales bacterium]
MKGYSVRVGLLGLALVVATTWTAAAQAAPSINVYSARKEALIKPLIDEFTRTTGIAVNLLNAEADQLFERLKNEGANSPADVLLTVDAGWLVRAKEANLLRPMRSTVLSQAVPSQWRDPNGAWYGLSMRARVFFYAKDRVKPLELTSYEDLALPHWKGRLCIRSSNNVYNQSLLGALIAHHGPEKAEAWAKAVVANLARKPQGGDTDQIKAVAAGECDLALANTYYYAGMLTSTDAKTREQAAKVALFWPNQGDRGTHVNISGAGVVAASKQPEAALKFIEFLASDAAQRLYAEVNFEFPVKSGVARSGPLAEWGPFKMDPLDVALYGARNAEAVRIFDRVGWR